MSHFDFSIHHPLNIFILLFAMGLVFVGFYFLFKKEGFTIFQRNITGRFNPKSYYFPSYTRMPASPVQSQSFGRSTGMFQGFPSQPVQGLPLGPAVGNPYRTGIVQGSAIAPLQLQYKSIFTPRHNSTISGQQQRQQMLAPGGLAHTGWVYRQHP